MLYTIVSDNEHRGMVWDSEQIDRIVGDSGDIENRIDLWRAPRKFGAIYDEPLQVTFPVLNKDDIGKDMPDICTVQGRLFLSVTAYEVLSSLLRQDGEFLPLVYEDGEAYLYTPLRTAEEVDGLDIALSRKNEWDDIEHMAFHENRVKGFAVFRTEFDGYYTLHCQQYIKEAIESAGLKGVYMTPNLGNIFPDEPGVASKLN